MILHLDMDAFYASASTLKRPDLSGRLVIVGGGGRGVVLSANYAARRSGVNAGMPMGRARRLCPHAVVLPPDFDLYHEISGSVMHVLRQVSPCVEPLSLDEAFVDLTGVVWSAPEAISLAQQLRDVIADEQGITASVGLASQKFVAKLASKTAKPDGLRHVPDADLLDFMHPLSVDALWGVGPVTQEKLQRLGLHTIGDIAHVPRRTLVRALGAEQGAHLHDLAWGRDSRTVVASAPERSIGSDETFLRDLDDPVLIKRHLLKLSDRVAARLRSAELAGRSVTVKVRFADFTTVTRSKTLFEHTDVSREIYATAAALYDRLGLQRARIRLVGVRVHNLQPLATTVRQGRLDERPYGWREADLAVDRASARFGAGAVRPASLMPASLMGTRESAGGPSHTSRGSWLAGAGPSPASI